MLVMTLTGCKNFLINHFTLICFQILIFLIGKFVQCVESYAIIILSKHLFRTRNE